MQGKGSSKNFNLPGIRRGQIKEQNCHLLMKRVSRQTPVFLYCFCLFVFFPPVIQSESVIPGVTEAQDKQIHDVLSFTVSSDTLTALFFLLQLKIEFKI